MATQKTYKIEDGKLVEEILTHYESPLVKQYDVNDLSLEKGQLELHLAHMNEEIGGKIIELGILIAKYEELTH